MENNYNDAFGAFTFEMRVLILVCLLEVFRVMLAKHGYVKDQKRYVILSFLLGVPSLSGVLYLLCQSKTNAFDTILSIAILSMQGMDFFTYNCSNL